MKSNLISGKRNIHSAWLFLIILIAQFCIGCSFSSKSTEETLDSIYISKMPEKVNYVIGEKLDLNGIEIKGKYLLSKTDKSESYYKDKIIEDWTSIPEEGTILSEAGEVSVIINYESLSTEFKVTVESASLESIYISKEPDKTEYDYNSILDLSGLIVKGRYSDNTEIEISDWTATPKSGTLLTNAGKQSIQISYRQFSASFEITVREKPLVISDSYFWGTWVRMDNGKEYEVFESDVVFETNKYTITASSENSLEVNELGTFIKESDSVMLNNSIPYFRKGGTNIKYTIRVVGFTSTGRQKSTKETRVGAKALSEGFPNYVSEGKQLDESQINANEEEYIFELEAATQNATQTIEVSDGNNIVVAQGLRVNNSGENLGTVALVGKNDATLKVMGTIDEEQKDNGYLFGNNTKEYEMKLIIKNISDFEWPVSQCVIKSKDPRLKLSSTENLSVITIPTMVKDNTRVVEVKVSYGDMDEPYIDTGITVELNSKSGQKWSDYVPLRFFKGMIPIAVSAKNPVDNKDSNTTLKGFIIYPDKNCQHFTVNNNSSEVIKVPTFGKNEKYLLVFSGATVTSTLSDSTEMYYSVAPGTINEKAINLNVPDWQILNGYVNYGETNDEEKYAFSAEEGFIAYISKGDRDYYKISADCEEVLTPDSKNYYSISYSTEYGQEPSGFRLPEDSALTEEKLPELSVKGMDFLGWYDGSIKVDSDSYKVSKDVTLTAKWQLKSYPVNYNLDGGTNHAANPSAYTIESSLITLEDPVRKGYDFDGWFNNEDFEGNAIETVGGGSAEEITLYAKWTPIIYSIIYNLAGGTNATANPVKYTIETDTITLAAPQKEGFSFGGWFTESDYSDTKQTEIVKGSYGNKTYYAKWLKQFRIIYETDHGTAPDSIIMGEGDSFTDSDLPILKESGWQFKGWYTNSSYDADTKVRTGQSVTTSLTLYAKWAEYDGPDDDFVFVEGGTVVGSNDYNQNRNAGSNFTGAFPAGRTVTLCSFYISDHELTQGEYETYCCYTSSKPSSSYGVGADYPVYYVSWYDAIVYCNLKSMAEGLTPCYSLSGETDPKKWAGIKTSNGKYSCSYTSSNSTWNTIACNWNANGYRLPTDAEWEYAARGGQETYGTSDFANYFAGAATIDYSAGSNNDLDSVGWYWYNICNNGITGNKAASGNAGYGTHEVKQKTANALGLYDMSGNVWEWCWDWYSSSVGTGNISNPSGPSTGSLRLARSGSWDYDASFSSVSRRDGFNPYEHVNKDGFRLVRNASGENYIRSFNVTYVNDHGTTPEAFIAEEGTVLTSSQLPEFTDSNWNFEGWYSDSSYTQSVSEGYEIEGETTLYAKWSAANGWYKTSFGSYSFVKNGNTWSSNNANKDSTTATSSWEVNLTTPIRYDIYYSVSSEEGSDRLSIVLDNSTVVNQVSGNVNSYYTAILSEGRHTITATYSKDSSSYSGSDKATITLGDVDYSTQTYITYTLNYNSSHGSCPAAGTVEKGSVLTATQLPELTDSNWNFEGWYSDSSYTKSVSEGYEVKDETTLYAKWSAANGWYRTNTGTYSFVKNGNTWSSNNANKDSTSATSSWEVNLTTPIRYTIYYSVSSETNSDKLTIVLDNSTVVNQISGNVNSYYTAILSAGRHTITAIYSKDVSSFSGSDKATITLGDVDYSTQAYITYTLYYNSSHGSCPASRTLEKGTVLTSEHLPELSENGWLFGGWYTNQNCSEGSRVNAGLTFTINMYLYAKWTPVSTAYTGFVKVDGGTFLMGRSDGDSDEVPLHLVTVSSFYMSDHEVTQGEYVAAMEYNPSFFTSSPAYGEEQSNRPVESVSWFDAIYFCNVQSVKDGFTPCYSVNGYTNVDQWGYSPHNSYSIIGTITCNFNANGYRLPTEAEWEYAARGGNKSYSYLYSGDNYIDNVAWYDGTSNGISHAVKRKNPNELGLYDMSGNVYEWCWDYYGDYTSDAQTNPTGNVAGYRVRRGGSWSWVARNCRSADRGCEDPALVQNYYGLRIVRSIR